MTTTKPSGVAWIGSIPTDWEMKKVKYIAALKGRIGWQGLTSDEYTDEGAFLITGTDFTNGGINWETCVHVPMKRWEEAKDIQIENGDLLITKDGTVGKVAIVSGLNAPCSLNSGVLRISTRVGYDKRFLFWVLQSEIFWTWFSYKNAGNSTILHLYQGDFAEFNYAIPPLDEQRAIAAFLDNHCGQIDGIIADLERQLELLRQYKKALITETVTKGLDKSASMKDSGLIWLGSIPQHWDMWKLGHCADIQTGPFGSQLHEEDYVDEGTPIITVEHFGDRRIIHENLPMVSDVDKRRLSRYNLRTGDLVFSRVGSVDRSVIVTTEEDGWLFSGRCLRVRPSRIVGFNPYFMNYFFASTRFKDSMTLVAVGSTMPSINTEILSRVRIARAPIDEQIAIVEFLDEKCTEMDALIAEKQRSLKTMQQYKRSLIYEYVTGKKRVVM